MLLLLLMNEFQCMNSLIMMMLEHVDWRTPWLNTFTFKLVMLKFTYLQLILSHEILEISPSYENEAKQTVNRYIFNTNATTRETAVSFSCSCKYSNCRNRMHAPLSSNWQKLIACVCINHFTNLIRMDAKCKEKKFVFRYTRVISHDVNW